MTMKVDTFVSESSPHAYTRLSMSSRGDRVIITASSTEVFSEDDHRERAYVMTSLTPDEARRIGQSLIDHANSITKA